MAPQNLYPPFNKSCIFCYAEAIKKVTFISQLFPIIAWLPTDIGKLNKTYILSLQTTEINARYILSPMEI